MERDLIIHKNAKGVQIALLENRRLVELHIDDNEETFSTGNIYLGQVKKINPGLRAGFINVGHKKEAFLHYTDLNPEIRSIMDFTKRSIRGGQSHLLAKFKKSPQIKKDGKIEDVLKRGDVILTQVLKEPISTKGPRLSCEIALPGRYVVLSPFGNSVGISKKISDRDERKRLQRVLESVRPKNFGVVARTNAIGKNTADIHQDIENLIQKWRRITTGLHKAQAPKLLLSEIDKSLTIIRDMMNDSFSTISTDDPDLFDSIKEYVDRVAPDKSKIIRLYKSKKPIFEAFNINRQIKSAFGRTVTMRSGAYLVIEHTEAMHVVDVNSGPKINRTENQDDHAFRVNKEAASEIARQLRLRNIGGIIVIDFIDMRKSQYRTELWRHMQASMKKDLAKHSILPISKFGLMEITRQRSSAELTIDTSEKLPGTNGRLESCLLILDNIRRDFAKSSEDGNVAKYIYVHPFVEAYMKKGVKSILNTWRLEHKSYIRVIGDSSFNLTDYSIHDKNGILIA